MRPTHSSGFRIEIVSPLILPATRCYHWRPLSHLLGVHDSAVSVGSIALITFAKILGNSRSARGPRHNAAFCIEVGVDAFRLNFKSTAVMKTSLLNIKNHRSISFRAGGRPIASVADMQVETPCVEKWVRARARAMDTVAGFGSK